MSKCIVVAACACVILAQAGCWAPPKDPSLYDPAPAEQAFRLRMDGKIDQARDVLAASLAAAPDNPHTHFETARLAFHTMSGTRPPDLSEAVDAIDRAVASDPGNPRYHYWAGIIFTYDAIVKMHSPLTWLPACLQAREATRSFERAVDLKPDYHEARLRLMGCYDRLPLLLGGDKPAAEAEARKLERMGAVAGARARCELKPRKTLDQQVALWRAAESAVGGGIDTDRGQARVYMRARKLGQARVHVDKVLAADPAGHFLLLELGQAAVMSRHSDEGERAYRRYLAAKPTPPAALRAHALRRLADIHKRRNQPAKADALCTEADALDPTVWRGMLPPEDLFTPP